MWDNIKREMHVSGTEINLSLQHMSEMQETGMIYSEHAIDYSKGVDIYDNMTGSYYTESEARLLAPEVRSRLTMKPRKIGCYVLTIEECDDIFKRRRNEQKDNV